MGVINITPNSFSDGGEFNSPFASSQRLTFLDRFHAIDIGAESTAPQSDSITWREEWERWQMILPFLKNINTCISIDSYHPETVFELVRHCKDQKLPNRLIWNDVSGKFDESVREFLKTGYEYIFCHNLAPTRALSGKHMDFVQNELTLKDYFSPHIHPQVLFDPCLGFSKTYEQNCAILDQFSDFPQYIGHNRWVLGFSRKSVLRVKYQTTDREILDHWHVQEVRKILSHFSGEIWVRTHRPELL